MVKDMYDLEGKKIKILTQDEIETNTIDEIENTIDLSKEIEEIKNAN